MRALVTGVAGFIGSALARRLLDEGHEVVGVDSLTDFYPVALKKSNLDSLIAGLGASRFRFLEADLNSVDLPALLVDIDYIFHQAGQAGVRTSWGTNFATYLRENVAASQTLLEAARFAPRLRRLVYASSSSVYGNAERFPTSELDLPRPVSPYGVTKLAAEHLMALYATTFGVPTVSLRYFTVYGPGQRPDMAFTRFLRAVQAGDEIVIYGDGSQGRDFTYVDDIVEANLAVATSDMPNGAVYNVSGGGNVTINEVLEMVRDVHGADLRVRYTPHVSGDVSRTGADISRIYELCGWRSHVHITEGIARQYAWARDTRAVGYSGIVD